MCFLAYFVYHICRTQCLQDSIVCTKVRRHTNMSYCVLAQCAAFAPRNAPSCADANCCVLPRELSIGTRADNILHCTGEVPARSARDSIATYDRVDARQFLEICQRCRMLVYFPIFVLFYGTGTDFDTPPISPQLDGHKTRSGTA